jgi:alpha-aminoadipic semialdehyde synthase
MRVGSAAEAGITVVNEVGLDPGLDHLLAMDCFDEVHQAGGKVMSFVSYCGGLPAPEYSDNAMRYKFSWSPRGALLNTLSTAKYLRNNEVGVPHNAVIIMRYEGRCTAGPP